MALSPCPQNRELLKAIVPKLTEISDSSTEQAEARKNGDPQLATALDTRLELLYGEKERAVGAWQEHVREHGC